MKKSRRRRSRKSGKKKEDRKRYRKKLGPVLIAVGLIALIISIYYETSIFQENVVTNGDGDAIIVPEDAVYHVHADFAVYINGKKMDFDSPIYSERDPRIHLHVRNQYGDSVIHVEARDVKLGDLFTSLGMRLTENCFRTRSVNFCNGGNRTLKFYVNGIRNDDFGDYDIKDLDRILITYGNETEEELKKRMDSVTKVSCISSDKCVTPQDVLKL